MEEGLQLYSYVVAVLSGVVFWAGFLVFGIIARRYNVVFRKETYYAMLMTAPSGILAYSLLLLLKTSLFVKSGAMNEILQLSAYIFLFASAAMCLFAVLKFNKLLDELNKYKEQ